MSLISSIALVSGLLSAVAEGDSIKVLVNDTVTSMKAVEGPDGCSMKLSEALSLMTGGKAKAALKAGAIKIDWEGKAWMSIPLAPAASTDPVTVTVNEPPGSATSAALTMGRAPWVESGSTMVDPEELGRILRVWVDPDRDGLKISTPQAWLKKLGIQDSAILNGWRNSILAVDDFGVSPPGRTLRAFIRPSSASYVQIYKMLAGEVPEEALGVSLSDKRKTLLSAGVGVPDMWEASKLSPVFAEYTGFNSSIGQESFYIGIVSKIKVDDPLEAIKEGKLNSSNATVVGVSQRFADLPFEMDRLAVKSGETLAALSARLKMTPELVAAFNGLDDDPKAVIPASVTSVLTIGAMKPEPPESECRPVSWVAAMPGQTLNDLARDWKVTAEQVVQFNPNLRSRPLEPGMVLLKIAVKNEFTYTISEDGSAGDYDVVQTADIKKFPTGSAPSIGSVEAGELFVVDKVVRPNDGSKDLWAFGSAGGATGFVPVTALKPLEAKKLSADAAPEPSGGAPGPDTPLAITNSGPMVPPPSSPVGPPQLVMARNAVQYIGTPYRFGGASLTKGIDCSHFVWRVRTLAGLPCPSPPVSFMETKGQVVDQGLVYSKGRVERGGKYQTVSVPTNRSWMRIGDRMIAHSRKGWKYHTMLYLGKITYKGRKYTNGMAHSCGSRGIGLEDYSPNHRYKSIYAYAVRDAK